jgi:hypothetical protein
MNAGSIGATGAIDGERARFAVVAGFAGDISKELRSGRPLAHPDGSPRRCVVRCGGNRRRAWRREGDRADSLPLSVDRLRPVLSSGSV